MLKGIFLCVLLAVLSANSMAQPTGSVDPDAIMEREVRGVLSNVIGYLKKLGTGALNAVLKQKREAKLPNSEAINYAHSKRFLSFLLGPLIDLISKGKRDANST
uniref:Preproprotein pGQ n=1 Tax=Xenopus laevis TaxID=8355 RepID=B7ZSF7_XENLA|nr:Preproprotein pGQ [Xenopus laevis]AAI70508.1 Preproprotein pGQ [Xenopus laevis]